MKNPQSNQTFSIFDEKTH